MLVNTVSVPKGTGRLNEDFVGFVPTVAVVVDGAGIPGTESICRHGVAWYARRLGEALLGLSSADGDRRSLTTALADAIEQVTDEHRGTCDTASPISPSAMVAVLRVSGGRAEYLVLGDATLVLERLDTEPLVVTDAREVVVSRAYIPALEAASSTAERDEVVRELRSRRNAPGGFWVAKDDPRAADEALTGSLPAAEVRGVALMSNGAARVVDRFGLADWTGVLAELATLGPAHLIGRVRAAEQHHGVAPDDATIAHCTELGRPPEPVPGA